MNILIRYLRFIILIPIFVILFFIFKQHVSSFGCFDDCFNFMGAFFMLKGKALYSQIFFNHQMLMAYISFLVQKFLHPKDIYHLVLYHRYVAIFFAFTMDLLIVWRFGWKSMIFVVCYEFTKYYFFGDRFLAEGFIVYPLVYTFGVVLDLTDRRSFVDATIITVGTWFVIFSREPYIPIALFLFLVYIFFAKKKYKLLSIFLLFLLSFLILYRLPLQDYWFNVFTLNNTGIVRNEISANGGILLQVLKSVGYPFIAVFSHKNNFIGQYLAALSVLFLTLIALKPVCKKWLELFIILIALFLANLRFVSPGTIFYESFHMNVWYALFLFSLIFLSIELIKANRLAGSISLCIIFASWIFVLFSPNSYIWEKINRQSEFVTHYGQYVSSGNVIRTLSNSSDTLFLDGYNDLIYWQADRISDYPYSWYTSFMPGVPKYVSARELFLRKTPPDFYYGFCTRGTLKTTTMPVYLKDIYTQIYFSDKPSCIYVKKTEIKQINKSRWDVIAKIGYHL